MAARAVATAAFVLVLWGMGRVLRVLATAEASTARPEAKGWGSAARRRRVKAPRVAAAWAGALGVGLGGRNVYPGGIVEHRGLLGDGPRPTPPVIAPAVRLVRAVGAAALAVAVLVAGARR